MSSAPGGAHASRPSIALRLSVLFVVGSLAVLLSAGVYLYFSYTRGIFADEAQSVSAQADAIERVLARDPDLKGRAGADLRRQYQVLEGADYLLRVRDEYGRTVYETPGLEGRLPAHALPAVDPSRAGGPVAVQMRRRNGRTYVVASAVVDTHDGHDGRRIVQVAYDGTLEASLLDAYRRRTLVAMLVGSLVSLVCGVGIARRGLAPLAEITRATERITAAHLHERIGTRAWPRELTSLASAFDEMLGRLELAVSRLSQFSADLAHELRTPLNNLIGEAEVWLSRPRTGEEYRAVVESNLEECRRLARLTEELLFLARVESDKLRIERVPVDGKALAEEVRSFYEVLAEERGIRLVCEGSARLVGSPSLLRRALINLVSNAVKFTGPGGTVRIGVAREGRGSAITVTDDGCGIEESHLSRIFDRFYRVDSSRAREGEGVGLGLAIVKSIAELHGARVEVESKVHQGTRVTLTLPDA
jgi:two-component system heavy metal sensor histidine kinase CusS